jgi:hypothetical protein
MKRPRKPASFSQSVHHRLNMYALAASAAGVGLLVLTPPAEAKIVYTKTHQVIRWKGIYNLDLNHDGIVDFVIQQAFGFASGTIFAYQLAAQGAMGNAVAGSVNTHNPFHSARWYGSALKPGAQVGPHRRFVHGGKNGEAMVSVWTNESATSGSYGKWIDVTNRYLGLKFKIKGEVHYGWARLSVHNVKTDITGTLTGYAYETIPNKAIIAGATKGTDESLEESDANLATPTRALDSLGILALGAPGLSIWRREESAMGGSN